MKASSASEKTARTSAQEKTFRRMAEDLAASAVTLVFDKVNPTKEGLQRMIEKGDEWGTALKETLITQATQLCELPLRYLESVSVVETKKLVLTKELLEERFNIKWLGENAKRLLLGRPVPAAKAKTLAVHQLEKWQTGQQLKDERGMGDRDIIASMIALVEKQKDGPKSPEGILLVDGCANIVIVELGEINDEGAVIKTSWAFSFSWGSDYGYWGVVAGPLGRGFGGVYRLFSSELL